MPACLVIQNPSGYWETPNSCGGLPLSDLSASFPNRPLKLHRTGIWPGILSYLGGLLLLALAIFLGVTEVPGIVRDLQISQDPVIAENGGVSDGECSTRKVFFVDCSAQLVYEVKGK